MSVWLVWLVYQKNYTKATGWMHKKLGQRIGLDPEQTLLICGSAPYKGRDPGIFSHLF